MIKLIKNGTVYSPEYQGKKDILIVDRRIGAIDDDINVEGLPNVEVLDAEGKLVVPGFIDNHVHIMGGGGEGSYKTRTPELQLSDAIKGGITTLVGVIGTDGTTRTMASLVAKAKGIKEEGLSCFIQTGSYQVPVKTLTGSVEDDIILIEEIIGAGEIAIADHRSSQPTYEELAKIASQARVAGMLSGKAGIVNVHIGDSPSKLLLIEEVVEKTDIPIRQFLPTHINRNRKLFEAGINYAKSGGYVDFTTSSIEKKVTKGQVKCSEGLKEMLEAGVPLEHITFTSDGQASLPEFDENGVFIGLQVGRVTSLYKEVRDAIVNEKIEVEKAIKVITSNPADILKFTSKGYIEAGKDADLVILNQKTYDIESVIALGQTMMWEGDVLVKGTFE
ncbi:beta-aspartyl-peptidase [Alkalihalobacterium chitinilyticum]|uniref:Isoaspartyl dipeptidase n=1 Tax=Alkalihalobacterium chitinilyticum TaxID=2980103 RepID=A0ABT5VHG8_9BACI|nr:beta-aspartyl-peptidase [Alkalihalobacterium chitinilyticum]MDE5414893.1 beta-aspartyl-peptidase [Alkalihalobacterium chitinilyticum]